MKFTIAGYKAAMAAAPKQARLSSDPKTRAIARRNALMRKNQEAVAAISRREDARNNGLSLQTGVKGGKFYMGKNGEKVYVKE